MLAVGLEVHQARDIANIVLQTMFAQRQASKKKSFHACKRSRMVLALEIKKQCCLPNILANLKHSFGFNGKLLSNITVKTLIDLNAIYS